MTAISTLPSPTRDNAQLQVFRRDVWLGLSRPHMTLPCKYFYDRRGSLLFDQICELPEYYPTRTESAIMRDHADQIAHVVGLDAALVEYGSGSSTKTRILLDRLVSGRRTGFTYVPIDISQEHLHASAGQLRGRYPGLSICPVCADYTQTFELPRAIDDARRRVVFFPGSTIGNFHPADAAAFLRRIADVAGRDGAILLGVDLRKAPAILEAAYDDARGVTAAFNLNLLARINRELDGNFDLAAFGHRACWNDSLSRIEMHLVSLRRQTATVAGRTFAFAPCQTIHTESSYKYSLASFAALAADAGLAVRHTWTDPARWFSIHHLAAA